MKNISSFDIFDTLLTRKLAAPQSLFLLLGQRAVCAGIVDLTPVAFMKQRILAEAKARIPAPEREANFQEIYRVLTENLNLTKLPGEMLAELELAVESENLVPVPGAVELVQRARAKSHIVYFISDMYLPPMFIRNELQKHGFFQNADQIYLSSEWRASKANGTLFQKILELEQVRPNKLHHVGDRIDADFESPSKLGIKARHVNKCILDRYEQMLEEFAAESIGLSSLLAGVSRIVRLQANAPTKHLKCLSQISASVISPIITFYALWLIREAKKCGIRRMYFVARDGYLIKKITDAALKCFGLSIETRYLYGSRQAWHIPAITDFSPTSLTWLIEKTRTLNLRIVLSRLQIIPEQITKILIQVGFPPETWDIPANEEVLGRIKTQLLENIDFRQQVRLLVAEKRRIALNYLEQEGLFESTPSAIVDLGWHGRLQQSFQKLLHMRKEVSTLGFYFGLYGDSPALSSLKTASYLGWDLRNPPGENEIPALVFLMESFCTAPHGTTIGYRQNPDGTLSAECREEGFSELRKWGVETVHATVERFAEELAKLSLPEKSLEWNSQNALVQILGTFSKDPLAEEGQAWGRFPYEDEQGGVVCERLTKSYELSPENLRAALVFGNEKYIPASWNVLWGGAQPHVVSLNNDILKLALRTGRTKKLMGEYVRRLIGT